MYKIIAIVGLIIRQFFLPNPFTPFGVWGEVYNLLASAVIGFLSYITVGLFYEKGSFPFWGSILYTITYIVFTFELCFIMRPYPNEWLMGLSFLIAILVDIIILRLLRKITDKIV